MIRGNWVRSCFLEIKPMGEESKEANMFRWIQTTCSIQQQIRLFQLPLQYSTLWICFLPLVIMPVRTRSFLAATTAAGARMATNNHPKPAPPIVPSLNLPTDLSFSTLLSSSACRNNNGGKIVRSMDPAEPTTPDKNKRRKIAAVVTPGPPSPIIVSSTRSTLFSTSSKTKKMKQERKKRKAIVVQWRIRPPDDWQNVYSLVKELRSDRTAPCDHSGCEALPEKPPAVSPETFRFQVLLSLMLSSQTKDAVVGAAIRAMQKDKVASVSAIAHDLSPQALNAYIQKCGFHNNKTKYILETVRILQESYGGDIPRTATELRTLPGVGPKMAYICESVAWGTQSGIGVDTHMHRLFNQLKFVEQTKTPEQTRVQLESWLPQELWGEVNLLWVGFGQEVQQEKTKILRKALDCTRPVEALMLLKRCGLRYKRILETDDIARADAIIMNSNNEKE